MRELKFRIWKPSFQSMNFVSKIEYLSGHGILDQNEGCNDNPVWMQFTGLKDKNSKEIYEGDIVILPDTESEFVDVGIGVDMKVAETPVNSIGEIRYVNGGFGIYFNESGECWEKGFNSFHTTDYTKMLNCDTSDLEKEIEIIGNIYENPELLNN